MIEKSPLSEQRIIDCLKINYGIEVATLTFLPLGADMYASVYKAQTHDRSSYFVKLKRGHHHDNSTIIIALLGNAGIQQIIPIVKTIRGQATQRIDDFTLTVSPFVDGRDGFSRDLTDDQWYTLGKVMRQIHEINVPLSIQAKIRQESYSPKWRQAVQSLYPLIEAKPSGDMIAIKLLTFMKKHKAAIHRLVDRAEQLAQKVQDQPSQFVLCHSDLHGGNVLIDENDIIYIVDWDDPIIAPKERDLMFIGGGVANVWNKPHEKELCYKGYGKFKLTDTLGILPA
jgi:spectinomycin phosphotransferase